jgi:hypothetical protein
MEWAGRELKLLENFAYLEVELMILTALLHTIFCINIFAQLFEQKFCLASSRCNCLAQAFNLPEIKIVSCIRAFIAKSF